MHNDVKDELKNTSIQITCLDEDGNVLKRVTSGDSGDIEDTETEGGNTQNGENGGTQGGGTNTGDNGGNQGGGNNGGGTTDPDYGDIGDGN